MKPFLLPACVLFFQAVLAQPPGRPDQPIYTIPKKSIVKPQNPKLIPLNESILIAASWHGVRSWETKSAITIDSITLLSFLLQSKQVTWIKKGWESVSTMPGTYSISGNKITIRFSYAPYTHIMEGTLDAAGRKITGTFREERASVPNQPPAYQPGTTTGSFEIIQK